MSLSNGCINLINSLSSFQRLKRNLEEEVSIITKETQRLSEMMEFYFCCVKYR